MVRARMHGQGSFQDPASITCTSFKQSITTQRVYFSLNMQLKHQTIPPLSDGSPQKIALNPELKATTFRFERLSQYEGLTHEIFTRLGGVSRPPYDTLNVGNGIGDTPENVRINLQIIMGVVGTRQLRFMNQLHGKNISLFRKDMAPTSSGVAPGSSGVAPGASGVAPGSSGVAPGSSGVAPGSSGVAPGSSGVVNGDAIISNQSNIAVMAKSADCQTIILFDPVKRVVSNVHCGWRGNTLNIAADVVARMKSDFQCKPSHILAAIGPSLGPCCAEFVTHGEIFPKNFDRFMVRRNYFDLWRLSRWQLLEAGLKKENIEVAGICTRCRTDLFYSYRAEGATGRFATVVMLK